MKTHYLRVAVPSDDKVMLNEIQDRVREWLQAKGTEVISDVVADGEPQADLPLSPRGRRIHWPATEVLQHANREFSQPRPPKTRGRDANGSAGRAAGNGAP